MRTLTSIVAAIVATTVLFIGNDEASASTNHIWIASVPGSGCMEAAANWGLTPHSIVRNNGLWSDSTASHTVVCPIPTGWDSLATSATLYLAAYSITLPANSSATCTLAAIDTLGNVLAYNTRTISTVGAATVPDSWTVTAPLSTTELRFGIPPQLTLTCNIPHDSNFRGAYIQYQVTMP